MNLNQPLTSSVWIGKQLKVSNEKIVKRIDEVVNSIKKQHLINKNILKDYFIESAYYTNDWHRCYLISKNGFDYILSNLHIDTKQAINLINKAHQQFKKSDDQLSEAISHKKNKYTFVKDFLKYKQDKYKRMNHYYSIKQAFYVLYHTHFIKKNGMPTSKAISSKLVQHVQAHWKRVKRIQDEQRKIRDARKIQVQSINYRDLLADSIIRNAYALHSKALKLENKKQSSKLLKNEHYLNQIAHSLVIGKIYQMFSKESLLILINCGYKLKEWGKKQLISSQVETLKDEFQKICKAYMQKTTTVNEGLDGIEKAICPEKLERIRRRK